jgi:hypothetical protein
VRSGCGVSYCPSVTPSPGFGGSLGDAVPRW